MLMEGALSLSKSPYIPFHALISDDFPSCSLIIFSSSTHSCESHYLRTLLECKAPSCRVQGPFLRLETPCLTGTRS